MTGPSSPLAPDVVQVAELAASPAAPPPTDREMNARVARWKRAYAKSSAAEAECKTARAAVIAGIIARGEQRFTSLVGLIQLETRDCVAYEKLARSILAKDFFEQVKQLYTTTSEPFVRALPGWSGAK